MEEIKQKRYRCKKCKKEAGYVRGFGHFCPNPDCENIDWGVEEIE